MKRVALSLLVLLFLAIALLPCRGAGAAEELPNLSRLLAFCEAHRTDAAAGPFLVPRTWILDPAKVPGQLGQLVEAREATTAVQIRSPRALLADAITRILAYHRLHGKDSSSVNLQTGAGVSAVSALPRLMTMYDHDGDGLIGAEGAADITLNAGGVREMGTFAKNILVLPYLKALGCTTVHFQPITEIGLYGRKGNIGSPFAISDPFSIDARLRDPLFAGTVEEQYRAFIEAAHALGMKVVQEVIPRTVSIDSRILEEHPDYGYWVKDGCPKRMPEYWHPDYEYPTAKGKMRFPDRAAFEKWFFNEYKDRIYGGKYVAADLIDVTKTDPEYTAFFLPPPDTVRREPSGKLVGLYWKKDAGGKPIAGTVDESLRAEVFPAFCDTPFEIQPFWADVTYLRLYADNDATMPMLRPLSFVTAKFFKEVEPDIERRFRYEPVWNMVTGYFDKFKSMGVDGFVLDMGHALPEDMKVNIRKVLPTVWEENLGVGFSYLARTPVVVTGNVFAYVMPSYSDRTEMRLYEDHPVDAVRFHIKGMRKLVTEMAAFDDSPGKMFGCADNYNTKRIGQTPATRDLAKAPKRAGTAIPDFTLAPVDPVKARRMTLLYDTLMRILSRKGGSPFVLNPVLASEFVPTSTVNVGLSTHIAESNRFDEYLPAEERGAHPDAPRLLLMSKPRRQGEEWTNRSHIIGEILQVNRALDRMKPLLDRNTHLEVRDAGSPEVLYFALTQPRGGGKAVGVAANLDLERELPFRLPSPSVHYYLKGEPDKGERELLLAPGSVTVFTFTAK